MPSIRIGFATDINLVNEQVGIGTTNPTARLDVRGQIRANNSAGGGGITTFTTYDGFLHSQQNLTNNISIASTTRGNLNSLSGEIKITGEVTVSDGTPITGGRLDSLTVTGSFDLPSSGSVGRELKPEKGSTRFNQDLGQLEFYTGTEWRTVGSYDGSGRGRGVFGGGQTPSVSSVIDFVNISSTGNALNFGTLSTARSQLSACSSSTHSLFGGGNETSPANTIDYITIASTGNAQDFGDLTVSRRMLATCSSSTRGIFGGGISVPVNVVTNVIDYVQISTLGNALDFGDLTIARRTRTGAASSPTRGVFLGGTAPTGALYFNVIDFITIASTGNAVDFGDSLFSGAYRTGCSNAVRGLFGGGYAPLSINAIEYLTIATTGNSIYFGDLTAINAYPSACSSSIRGIFGGGLLPSLVNTIDFITINTAGNAQDFGDLTQARGIAAGCSDSHGGLGGF